MCSVLHHWVCILMFEGHFIEYVCWREFVCDLSETHYSLYSFCRIFWEWDEWPSLRSSGSLSFPSLRSLLMWLHFMFDFERIITRLCVLCFTIILVFVFYSSHLSHILFFFFIYIATYSLFDTSFASSLHISLSVQFSSLPLYWYYIHIRPP